MFISISGFMVGRYNEQPVAKLGFDKVFWDSNAYWMGKWLNVKQCAGGASFNITYRIYDANFNQGNLIFVELSDEFGVFSSPIVIGAVSSVSQSGSIVCLLPSNLINGTEYRSD